MAVARGNEKGRVERSIRYIRDKFFAARTPTDLDDLSDEEELQRDYLRQAFRFRLLDAEGNRHDLQLGYTGTGRDGRNTFFLAKQPPRR